MKKLDDYGVHVLDATEVKKIDGGWRIFRVLAAALAALHDQVCDGQGQCEMNLTPQQASDYRKYRAI